MISMTAELVAFAIVVFVATVVAIMDLLWYRHQSRRRG